jgi:hypothetical protein
VHLRIGNLTLAVALAVCTLTPSARASAPPRVVRVNDLDYVRRTYYFIADHPVVVRPGTLHVWRDDRIQWTNVMESPGIARLDPTLPGTTAQILGYFSLLQQDEDYFIDYPWVTGGNGEIPVLHLRQPLNSNELLAVSYVDDLTGVQVGTISGTDFANPDPGLGKPANTLLVKLIAMELGRVRIDPATMLYDPTDPFYRVIAYELRNFYDLGVTQIPEARFQLRVRLIQPGDDVDAINGVPLMVVLGLDQRSAQGGEPDPDGIVDDQFIDHERGLIYFPDLRPFAPDTSQTWCAPGFGGFLCIDDLHRNLLRSDTGTANRHVYETSFPDLPADAMYYLEATISPPPEPGGVLHQNAPNPFNPGTRIAFDLNLPARARVAIYDIRGRLVDELLDRELPPGPHSVSWNGKSGTNPVASGVYYYVLETGGHRYTRRMVLAR